MLNRVFQIRLSLKSFNGAWAPMLLIKGSQDVFLEGQVLPFSIPKLFGGMTTLHGKSNPDTNVTGFVKISNPGISNVIASAEA